MRLKQCEFPHSYRRCTVMSASSCGIWSFLLMVNPTKHNAGQLPLQQPLKCASVFIVGRPRGTYFCNLASMLSSFAAVMTFGCRPPVSHDLAANAAPATGRQPRLRSVCQPPLLMYTWTLREGAFEKKKKTLQANEFNCGRFLFVRVGFLKFVSVDSGRKKRVRSTAEWNGRWLWRL